MSWLNLNSSLNSLKGQLTNLAAEVLSEGSSGIEDEQHDENRIQELLEQCRTQEKQIASLQSQNEQLQAELRGRNIPQNQSQQNGDVRGDAETWFWDPSPANTSQLPEGEAHKNASQELFKENTALKEEIKRHKNEIEELKKLREENASLTTNLEDLDTQHQLAMERLLTLKKQLQRNFEILKQEHEDLKSSNSDYLKELELVKNELQRKEAEMKATAEKFRQDYDSLHHKYANLEKVYGVLQEQAEQFQEENQSLHEEIFKLEEELAKRNEDEVLIKDKYAELLKKLEQTKHVALPLDDSNIDDNAKSLIQNLKHDISDLKRQLANTEAVETNSNKGIDPGALTEMYNQYVNFNLTEESIDIIKKIQIALKTLSSCKRDLDILKQELSEKELQEKNLQTQMDDLNADNEFLQADLTQCERELSDMKKNNDFLLAELATMKSTSKLEPISETHEDNIAKLETELADCNKINKSFENEIKTIKSKLAQVQEEKLRLQADLGDLKRKYSEMLNELEIYKQNNERKTQDCRCKVQAQEMEDLKNKLIAAASKNETLQLDYSIAQNDVVILTQKVEELNLALEENNLKMKKIGFLESKLDDLERNMSEANRLKKEVELDRQLLVEKIRSLAFETDDVDQVKAYRTTFENSKQEVDQHIEKIINRIIYFKENETKLLLQIEDIKKQNNSETQELDKDINEKLNNYDMIVREIEGLREDKQNLLTIKNKLEHKLSENVNRIIQEESLVAKLKDELENKEKELENLRFSTTEEICALHEQVEKLNMDLKSHKEHDEALISGMDNLRIKVNLGDDNIKRYENLISELYVKVAQKEQEIENMKNSEHHILEEKMQIQLQLEQTQQLFSDREILANTLKHDLDIKEKELLELHASAERHISIIEDLKTEITTLNDAVKSNQVALSELQCNAEVAFESDPDKIQHLDEDLRKNTLQESFKLKEKEVTDLRTEIEKIKKALNDQDAAVKQLTAENNELISFVTVKHNENLQYHSEIQRLNQVILHHNEQNAMLIRERDESIQKQDCSECAKLKIALLEKDELLLSRERATQDVELLRRQLSSSTDTIRSLTEKCEELDKCLTIQLDAVKSFKEENGKLTEKSGSLEREVGRLREHLVETEEAHTQELLAAEKTGDELRSRLAELERRMRDSGAAYTTNNVRAQQELETLRSQLALMEREREESRGRVAAAEADVRRARDAAAALQCAIEQFQNEKEGDIETATSRLQSRYRDLEGVNAALRDDIAALTRKLETSAEALAAAARLTDQLHTANQMLQHYKQQVSTLEARVEDAERAAAAAARGAERVDRGLVKNLLLNYIHAPDKHKIQVLRILSTVLDLNKEECERAGLGKTPSTMRQDSLAAEFVKFLEKESRPSTLPPMPLPPSSTATSRSNTPQSRRDSVPGPPPILDPTLGHRRNASNGSNNVLFQHLPSSAVAGDQDANVLLAAGVNQPRDTEPAILKHVLNNM